MNPCRINANRTTFRQPETKRKVAKEKKNTFSEKPPMRPKAGFLTESVKANAEREMTVELEFYDQGK